MNLTRRHFVLTGAAALTMPGPARAGEVLSGPAFGSRWHARLADPAAARTVTRTVARVVDEYDRLFSPYLPGSALSRFNAARGTDWVPVPAELARAAGQCLDLCRQTGGAFDPTVGPLVHRFGFGPIRGGHPDAEGLDVRALAMRKTRETTTLDLCGLAKGVALDRMIADLAYAGVSDAMVELGGEVRCLGRHPDGRAWQIAVEDPRPTHAGGIRRVIAPGQRALATSGHAAQGHGGITHLIDPRSGRPADMRLASVTVLADSAEQADGLATALAALGPEDGPAFADRERIDALFLIHDRGGLAEMPTGRFGDHILG